MRRQPFAQDIVNARLPALARGAEGDQHIRVKADACKDFRIFQFRATTLFCDCRKKGRRKDFSRRAQAGELLIGHRRRVRVCKPRINGIATSAASVIAVGTHRVVIGESAMMMIHNPVQFVYDNAADLWKSADDLDKIAGNISSAYTRKAPGIQNINEMLDAET
jgi:hypothetical protein